MTMQKSTVLNSTPTIPDLAASLAMLLLLALLSYQSSGIIRGGEEDEGSGFGGTGRMAVPSGESGLGGTGFKPYLGMNETLQEIEINRSPRTDSVTLAATNSILSGFDIDVDPRNESFPEPVETTLLSQDPQTFTTDSSAIAITEQIQRDFDVNALQFERLKTSVSAASIADSNAPNMSKIQNISVDISAKESNSTQSDLAQNKPHADDRAGEDTAQTPSWLSLAQYIADSRDNEDVDVNSLAALDDDDSARNPARFVRPNRIQRPELPPIQRVRPLQRLNILPPPVRPLSL